MIAGIFWTEIAEPTRSILIDIAFGYRYQALMLGSVIATIILLVSYSASLTKDNYKKDFLIITIRLFCHIIFSVTVFLFANWVVLSTLSFPDYEDKIQWFYMLLLIYVVVGLANLLLFKSLNQPIKKFEEKTESNTATA